MHATTVILYRGVMAPKDFRSSCVKRENNDRHHIHTPGTAGDLAALTHAVELATTVGFGFALHVVVIVGATTGANEEAGAQ